jgi:antitoxin Phd
MRTLHLREAKTTFSAIVEAAQHGEPTIVTKHGRPAAMIVPIEAGRRIYPDNRPSFAELLLSIPHDLNVERDQSPMRGIDL